MRRRTTWTVVVIACLAIAAATWWIRRWGGAFEPADSVPASFDGVAVDENGQPIGGATLRVTTGWGKDRHVDPTEYPVARSGGDGRFTIPSKAWVEKLYVHASAAGRAPAMAQSPLHRLPDDRVVLLPAALVRVRVEDGATHAPVTGARVLAVAGSDARSDLPPANRLVASDEAVTDRTGAATLASPGGETWVVVLTEDHEPGVARDLQVPPAGTDVTVPLFPGGALEGRVLDPEGRPVGDALVLVAGPIAYVGRATTGADGAYRLLHVPADLPDSRTPATLKVIAAASAYPRAVDAAVPCPPPLGSARADFVLRPWVSIRGLVTDASGAPVAGARVRATEEPQPEFGHADADGRRSETVSDARGGFEVDEFSLDGGVLRASGPGGEAWMSFAGSPPLASDGSPALVSLVLKPPREGPDSEAEPKSGSGEVAGRVARMDGTPARIRLRLTAEVREGEYASRGVIAATDAEGRFRFQGLGSRRYLVSTEDPGFTFTDYPRVVRAGDADLRLVAMTPAEDAAYRIEAEILDAESGQRVKSSFARMELRASVASESHRVDLDLWRAGTARTRDRVPGGTYSGVVRVDGYLPAEFSAIRVPDAGAAPRLRVRLERPMRVEGVALDADGRPVPGVVEALFGLGGDRVTIGSDGRYRASFAWETLGWIALRGDFVVSADVRQGKPSPSGVHRVDFVIKTGGAVRVHLKDGRLPTKALVLWGGAIAPGAAEPASVENMASVESKRLGESGGAFTIPGVPVGRYRITPTWDDTELPPRDVDVRDRETTTIEIAGP